jgi:hypothetical protein
MPELPERKRTVRIGKDTPQKGCCRTGFSWLACFDQLRTGHDAGKKRDFTQRHEGAKERGDSFPYEGSSVGSTASRWRCVISTMRGEERKEIGSSYR